VSDTKLNAFDPHPTRLAPPASPHTAAELNTILQLLVEREATTIAIGHGRDPQSAAAVAALAAAWQAHGGSVLSVTSWPARAASWLRQARRLTSAHPDAWVIADSAQGFAPMAARLLQQLDWSPAHTLGFAGLADIELISRVAPAQLHRLSGATADGRRWRIGRATLIIDEKSVADND
jgi:Periplasmic binding protein